MVLPQWKVMLESAVRTFLIAALPAFGTALAATHENYGRSALAGAGTAALAAGLAAIARALKPLSTDAQGVGVAGVGGTPHDLSK